MATKSRIDNTKICYRCGSGWQIDKHHLICGTANRKLSEEDGLFIYLCHECHMKAHEDAAKIFYYKQLGQCVYEKEIGTREEFRKRYGKSFLS